MLPRLFVAEHNMENLDFSEEEIQEQLAILGYKNIPKHRLREFKRDLDELIRCGDWKTLASPTLTNSPTSTPQPSPPAYTKEKISQCSIKDSGEGFFLHPPKDSNRQVLPAWQSTSWQQGSNDSYAEHSVASKVQLPPGAPSRLHVELDPDDTLIDPSLTDSITSSPDRHGRRFIKRKVLRKHKGQSLVCDESVYSEDSEAASCLEDRLADLHISTSTQHDFETEIEDETSQDDTQSSDGITASAFESYIRGLNRRDTDFRPKPKSFIRPVRSQPTIKKSDPVTKYFQYKQLWDMFKQPGEKDRRALRWEIREQLAHQPPPPKPRRVYVPNTYVVPTEKKRSALRWEIRNTLANGLLPHKFNYEF